MMGFNTVALLLNDHADDLDRDPEAFCKRLRHAWRNHDDPRERLPGWFGAGQIISESHADYPQVVFVHRNSGERLTSEQASPTALAVIADLLRWHGYAVRSPGEKRALSPYKKMSPYKREVG